MSKEEFLERMKEKYRGKFARKRKTTQYDMIVNVLKEKGSMTYPEIREAVYKKYKLLLNQGRVTQTLERGQIKVVGTVKQDYRNKTIKVYEACRDRRVND